MPSPVKLMPALANANTGSTKKATTECRSCSRLFSGELPVSTDRPSGMNIASTTPASVAWTPDFSVATHMMMPIRM